MIIAAYAGTGKTTFAKNHPNEAIDFVCMPYKYYLDETRDSNYDSEAVKADDGLIMRDEWPLNYAQAIREILDRYQYILIPPDTAVLKILQEYDIPYYICYPQRDAKEEYRERYLKRGNTASFLDVFIEYWDHWMNAFERDTYGARIILKPGQYLSDVFEAKTQ
jgi:hypothetical protein